MYENIDSDETPKNVKVFRKHRNRAAIGLAILTGIALLIVAALSADKITQPSKADQSLLKAERAEYKAALTDRSQALRRARLTDFIATYPQSKNLNAAEAQLEVLTAKEQADWAALSFVVFDTTATRLDKFSALETYKTTWDVGLLGGRKDDVVKIEQALKDENELPSRELDTDPEAFPNAVDRDTLVGGEFDIQGTYIPPSVTFQEETIETEERVVILAPRLRRNATPKYPRRAERNGVEAVVILELFINADGRVEDTDLISVDAPRYKSDFVRASERAARRLRFYPRTINGTSVSTEGVEKRFRFQISE